jgi:DHA1 family multidrug resistance protein-like MFS transporter
VLAFAWTATMKGLMRDTAFGQIVRLVSGRRFFKYSEEENHELWKQFIDEKKSANLARHGTVEPPEDDDEKEKDEDDQTPREDSDSSSRTHVDGQVNEASGVKVDPEKGRDINLVSWYGPDDPENPQNWTVSFYQKINACQPVRN